MKTLGDHAGRGRCGVTCIDRIGQGIEVSLTIIIRQSFIMLAHTSETRNNK